MKCFISLSPQKKLLSWWIWNDFHGRCTQSELRSSLFWIISGHSMFACNLHVLKYGFLADHSSQHSPKMNEFPLDSVMAVPVHMEAYISCRKIHLGRLLIGLKKYKSTWLEGLTHLVDWMEFGYIQRRWRLWKSTCCKFQMPYSAPIKPRISNSSIYFFHESNGAQSGFKYYIFIILSTSTYLDHQKP